LGNVVLSKYFARIVGHPPPIPVHRPADHRSSASIHPILQRRAAQAELAPR